MGQRPQNVLRSGLGRGSASIPSMVRHFQSVIGKEARQQMLEETGRLPSACLACVGGGSNAIGIFAGFMDDPEVRLIGVEPGGRGNFYGGACGFLCLGTPGIMHGFKSYMVKDGHGEPGEVYSISAGLDYPSVGPEHAQLKDAGRAQYVSINDKEALDAFFLLSRHEGIPASAGIVPCCGGSHKDGARNAERRHIACQSLWQGRQGRGTGGGTCQKRLCRGEEARM